MVKMFEKDPNLDLQLESMVAELSLHREQIRHQLVRDPEEETHAFPQLGSCDTVFLYGLQPSQSRLMSSGHSRSRRIAQVGAVDEPGES